MYLFYLFFVVVSEFVFQVVVFVFHLSKFIVDLVRALVLHRATSVAPSLRASVRAGLARRYWGILSVAIQRAGAESLFDEPPTDDPVCIPLPSLETLLAGPAIPDGVDAPEVSRLPPSLS